MQSNIRHQENGDYFKYANFKSDIDILYTYIQLHTYNQLPQIRMKVQKVELDSSSEFDVFIKLFYYLKKGKKSLKTKKKLTSKTVFR